MNAEERAAIKARYDVTTEGPWEVGNWWHTQGASFCPCNPEWGPAIVQRMNINGKMMLAHRHRRSAPLERDTIYTEPWPDGYPRAVVVTTSEYGAINRYDAEFIAHAREDVPALLTALEQAEEKLTAIEAEVKSWHTYETHDIGGAFHESVRDILLDILDTTIPKEMQA